MSSKLKFIFETKNKVQIPVYEIMPRTDNLIIAANKHFRNEFGNEYERRSYDHFYNCHGMTFIGKQGCIGLNFSELEENKKIFSESSKKIVEQKNREDIIQLILEGNNFRRIIRFDNIELDIDKISDIKDIKRGDIVIYKDIRNHKEEVLHSAIIMKLIKLERNAKLCNIQVLSKLGDCGEYFHSFNTTKVLQRYGKIVEIWTDREINE